MKQIIFFTLLLIAVEVNAQITNTTNTCGLLYSEPEKVSDGYILFAPLYSQHAYLIDNCGLIVNKWTFVETSIYSGCYLLEDGSILKLTSPYAFGLGNSKTCIEHLNWNGVLLWQYCVNSQFGDFHSDMHILPNGNILVLMLEYFTVRDAILSGVDPMRLDNDYTLESVVELKPIGMDSAEVVWQWRMKDHLIQEFDDTRENYGIVADHPRKYDANLYEGFTHFNSIDYNETLDQIVLSSWNDHEIYIIDHSTTTEEAAGSTGGRYGYGGDFLFRWGKPENYGIAKEQHLMGQHNPRWIPDNYEDFGGMISIFNNRYGELFGNRADKSAVVVINPDADGDGVYEMEAGNFLPETYHYILPDKTTGDTPMFSVYMSGAVIQPNGHFIACEAEKGRITEYDKDGAVLWMYQSPFDDYGYILDQGYLPESNGEIFKVEKYQASYAGLLGRDLCGTTTIENENPLSDECTQFWSPDIAFLHTIDGAKVDFSLAAENTDSLLWDFGDGSTSTENNPSHIFEMPGTYEVCVSSSNCYSNDRYCKSIEISVTAIQQINKEEVLLQTNIIEDNLHLTKNTIEKAIVYNEAGIEILQIEKTTQTISVKHLPMGIYFLLIIESDQTHFNIQRFVKL